MYGAWLLRVRRRSGSLLSGVLAALADICNNDPSKHGVKLTCELLCTLRAKWLPAISERRVSPALMIANGMSKPPLHKWRYGW